MPADPGAPVYPLPTQTDLPLLFTLTQHSPTFNRSTHQLSKPHSPSPVAPLGWEQPSLCPRYSAQQQICTACPDRLVLHHAAA